MLLLHTMIVEWVHSRSNNRVLYAFVLERVSTIMLAILHAFTFTISSVSGQEEKALGNASLIQCQFHVWTELLKQSFMYKQSSHVRTSHS